MIHFTYFFLSAALILTQLYFCLYACSNSKTLVFSQYFRPSQIALFYIFINYFFGSVWALFGIAYWDNYLIIAQNWTLEGCLLFAVVGIFSILVCHNNDGVRGLDFPNVSNKNKVSLLFLVTTGVILAFLSEKYLMAAILWSVLLFHVASFKLNFFTFFFIFITGIFLISIFSGSKRYFIFPIIILGLHYLSANKTSRKTQLTLLFSICVLVITMSAIRGYTFEIFSDPKFSNFVRFLELMGNNFEFSYFYFHGVNAIELFHNEPKILGESFLKGLLIGWNYVGLNHGLESSIDAYMRIFSPLRREIGASFPVNLISEFFINFGWGSTILFACFLWAVDKVSEIFLKIKEHRSGLIIYMSFLVSWLIFIRGSSFDLFVFYSILYTGGALIIYVIFEIVAGFMKSQRDKI